MIEPAESNLARLITRRHGYSPGDDLVGLVELYADLEYHSFPVSTVDGISLHLKSANRRPNILINSDIVETRAKFTLAHEFGHVIIPWHSGTIFSTIDKYSSSVDFAYREMEAEANRFAAELLMPSEWIRSLLKQENNPAKVFKQIRLTVGTSPIAILIAMNNALPAGYVFCAVDEAGNVQHSMATQGTFARPPKKGEHYSSLSLVREAADDYISNLKSSTFHWLFFEQEKKLEVVTDGRSWRELLDIICKDVDPDNTSPKLKMSLNGVVSTCNRKNISAEGFFSAVRQKLSGRGVVYERILVHPLFNSFLIKRIEEFVARRTG